MTWKPRSASPKLYHITLLRGPFQVGSNSILESEKRLNNYQMSHLMLLKCSLLLLLVENGAMQADILIAEIVSHAGDGHPR